MTTTRLSSTDRIERSIDVAAPLAAVWRALTDHREFGEWFRVKLEGPFIVGKATRGRLLYPGFEHVVFEAEVVTMERERRFAYRWHPAAVEANVDYSKEPTTLVEFSLEKTPSGTRLTVIESGFDAIPVGRRTEAYRMNSGGWEIQMQNIQKHAEAKA